MNTKTMNTLLAIVAAGGLTLFASPAFADDLIVVESAPPTPFLNESCGVVDPDPDDVWQYTLHADEVGNTFWADAYLPAGHVIGDTDATYWSQVAHGWEFTCVVPEGDLIPPAVTEEAPVVEEVPTLPATGVDPHVWVVGAVGAALVGGGVLLTRRTRGQS